MIVGINLISLPAETGGGAFRYIQLMLQAMAGYKLDTHFIIYKQKSISEKYLGIPKSLDVEFVNIPAIGSGIKRIVFEQTFFYRYLRPCDVLYSYCTSMPLLARCKKIFTLHDVYYLTTKERYGWFQRTYLTWITKIYCRVCDKVITVSEFSYEEIKKNLGLSEDKLVLTYNFIVPDNTEPIKPTEIVDVFGREVDTSIPFFFYLGDLQPGKNINGMLDGFIRFAGNRTDIQLLLAGKSSAYGDKVAEFYKESDKVFYLGYIPRSSVNWLQANCIGTVLLSFCEGFGIPPLEGFRYGKPALTSNLTSLPEVVGAAGVKVDPYSIDAIVDGFRMLEENDEGFTHFIPAQLDKFNPKTSVECFMNTLGINYSL